MAAKVISVAHEDEGAQKRRQKVAVWVKLVLLWHVICITVWSCPKPSVDIMQGRVKPYGSDFLRYWPQMYLKYDSANTVAPEWDKELIEKPIQCYLFTTGEWQYWDMFAPNPANVDWYGDALVTYKDKTTRVYQFPRMFSLPLPEKYFKERFRKFFERAHDVNYSYLVGAFAMRVALLMDTIPNNPPVKVTLRRYWLLIADPGKPQSKNYTQEVYFNGIVDQAELKTIEREGHW